MPNVARARPLVEEDQRWLAAELVSSSTILSQELCFGFILASEFAADFNEFIKLISVGFANILPEIPDATFPPEEFFEQARFAQRPLFDEYYRPEWNEGKGFDFSEAARNTIATIAIVAIT